MRVQQSSWRVRRQSRPNHRRRLLQLSIGGIHSRGSSHLVLRLRLSRETSGSCVRRASRSHRLLGGPPSACDWSQSMACRHVHMATRSPSICTIMDEAGGVDDDDDSIGGRCLVDDPERAVVRDLLVPLMTLHDVGDARSVSTNPHATPKHLTIAKKSLAFCINA